MIINKFKAAIEPLQMWLLKNGRCVGCGTTLTSGYKKVVKGKETVTCKCKRIYIKEGKIFRIAKLNEI